eukprot:GFKZ01009485.1.p1 GENE.GFKZ01009485.1~~GFKZ01009485.1.p1  ORF type:complete len:237 (+),score=38.21 GFKZ01009485.1:151-861(+)
MASQTPTKAVSQFPPPPRRYYQSYATQRHPPPPPVPGPNESYQMFGCDYTTEDTLPSIEDAGRKRLYNPTAPPCQELRRMNKELLDLFMQLVKALCHPLPPDAPPDAHQDMVRAIEDTFINMQHLINVMRPAQAAMDLKTMLDRQTSTRKEMTEKLKDSVKRAWDLIGEAAEKLSEPSVQLSEQARVPSGAPPLDPAKHEFGEGATSKFPEELEDLPRSPSQMMIQIAQIAEDPTL